MPWPTFSDISVYGHLLPERQAEPVSQTNSHVDIIHWQIPFQNFSSDVTPYRSQLPCHQGKLFEHNDLMQASKFGLAFVVVVR
jgi:hypothetical protein